MKTVFFLISMVLLSLTIKAQDAGIINPVDNLIIHEDNRDTYILTEDLDKVRIDGWSDTGEISNIKIYKMLGSVPDTENDIFLYYAENANSGSWYKDIDVGPGVHDVYINVHCNYSGCPLAGTNGSPRRFTYVKPYDVGNFYPQLVGNTVSIGIMTEYGYPDLNSDFYYRVYRNTSPTLDGGTFIGNWSQAEEVIDSNIETGQTYYYWVDVAINDSGSYNGGIIESEYRSVVYNTLSVSQVLLNNFEIVPNPTNSSIHIKNEKEISVKKISICDYTGKLIKSYTNNIQNIDISNLSDGIYVFHIETTLGNITKKIIKY